MIPITFPELAKLMCEGVWVFESACHPEFVQ